MKRLHYDGVGGGLRSCTYKVGELNSQAVVVFLQGRDDRTSITPVIEVLANRVLSTDLAGLGPDEVRFFAHYPDDREPTAEWREVQFGEAFLLDGESGLLAQALRFLSPANWPRAWAVQQPEWRPLLRSEVPASVRSLARDHMNKPKELRFPQSSQTTEGKPKC